MKSITRILLSLTLLVLMQTAQGAPQGRLICWDNLQPKASIPGYLGSINGDSTDVFGRNSFVMNFEEVPTYWKWRTEASSIIYGWSVSECEDMNYFIFPKSDLHRVLNNTQRSILVEYIAEGPDDTKKRQLRCVKLRKRNHKRAVFKFF